MKQILGNRYSAIQPWAALAGVPGAALFRQPDLPGSRRQ